MRKWLGDTVVLSIWAAGPYWPGNLMGPNHINCSLTPSGYLLHTQSRFWIVPMMNGATTVSGDDIQPHSARGWLEEWVQAAATSSHAHRAKSSPWQGAQEQPATIHWPREDERVKEAENFSQQILPLPLHYLLNSYHKFLIHSCVSLKYSLWDMWICFEFKLLAVSPHWLMSLGSDVLGCMSYVPE